MKKKDKKTSKQIKKIYPLLIVIATLFMSIGYSSLNSISLNIIGETAVASPEDVFIQDAYISENNEANLGDSNIILYSGTMLQSKVSLSKTNLDSTITMTVKIHNTTSKNYIFAGVTHGDNFYTDEQGILNDSIDYTVVNTTNETGILNSGDNVTFTITFKYSDEYKKISTQPYENILNSYLNFNFIETPTLMLSNENETYTSNIYPGYIQEYSFTVSNYNNNEINPTPMIYSFETTIDDSPLTAIIYDTSGNEVTESISIDGDENTKTEHTYTLKIIWDNETREYNYSDYENKSFKCNVKLTATPDSEVTLEYLLEKEFNVDINVSPFYFNIEAKTNISMEKEFATLPITISNYDSADEYNSFETEYEISIEGNDKFTLSINDVTNENNIFIRNLSGGSAVEDTFNIKFLADINTLNTEENITLKITPKSPYIDKEITLSLTINLQAVTVTFNVDGGSVSPSSMTVYKGRTYGTLPTPTWEYHTFDGWYTSDSYETEILSTTEVTLGNATQTLYAKWISHLLADNVLTGDYVAYDVVYNNVATISSGTHYAKLTGWRVLDTQTDENGDKYVRLMTAGIPMTYRHAASYTTSGETGTENLTTNFFSTTISSSSANNTFNSCGFQNDLGTIITIGTLKKLFVGNQYTQVVDGTPKVQSITLEDIKSVLKKEIINVTDVRSDDNLFAIPSSDQTSSYATYYLATPASNYYLWVVYQSGYVVYTYALMGVRPVVSLKPNVLTSGQINDVWQISIEE